MSRELTEQIEVTRNLPEIKTFAFGTAHPIQPPLIGCVTRMGRNSRVHSVIYLSRADFFAANIEADKESPGRLSNAEELSSENRFFV